MTHKIQKRVGNQWVPLQVRKRENGQWVIPQVRVRENGQWSQSILEKKVTETWEATWTQSYDGSNNIKPASSTLGRMYQGRYNEYDPGNNIYHNPVYWGRQRSMVGFNVQDIQKKLNGARIEKIELYLHIDHAWYGSGATAAIGVHPYASQPNKFDVLHYNLKEVKYNSRNEGKWTEFSREIGEDFKSGRAGGFTLYRESNDLKYYGYWHGMSSSSAYRPKLRITYYTNASEQQQTPEPVTKLPKYTKVLRGEGLAQVTDRLLASGVLKTTDWITARNLLVRLNNFSTTNPILQIGQLIKYEAGG